MPFRKDDTYKGNFTERGLRLIGPKICGCFMITDGHDNILHFDRSEDVKKSLQEIYMKKSHSIWHFNPALYLIEYCYKDLEYRYKQLRQETRTIFEEY